MMAATSTAFVPNLPSVSASTLPAPSFLGARSRLERATLWHAKRARTPQPRMQGPDPEAPGDDADPLDSVGKRDWREFRAALVVGSAEALQKSKETAYRTGHWAHPLATPETGCFLASHPAYYRRSAPYLTQAVVFVIRYEEGAGAAGLVLNRPLRGTVAELEADGMFGRSSNLSKTVLGPQPVYIGGPDLVESGVVMVLHGNSEVDVTSARQPLGGVYVGDVTHYLAGVDGGLAEPAEARLFAGCLRWGPGELEREVDEGSWYCVSASPMFALKHCIQLPKPLWVEIMQSQGKPFNQIASQVYDDDSEQERKE